MTTRAMKALSAGAVVLGLAAVYACANSTLETDAGSCPGTQVDCKGACVDVRIDHGNCGSCGKACGAAEVCSAGVCTTACMGGQTKCTGEAGAPYCANTSTDVANCGTCGNACPKNAACVMGKCGSGCSANQTMCTGDGGAFCTDTKTDTSNCGMCGKPCGLLETCVAGTCQSGCTTDAGTTTACPADGGPAYCADLQTDKTNCGVCGKWCSPNQTCVAGMCKTGCTPAWLASNQSWTQNNLTYASEILNASYNPTNLLDNVLTTRWVTASTTNQWVIFNFGAPMTLSGVQIVNQANYTPNAGGKDTILQTGTSLNGPWTNVTTFTVANQQNSFQVFNFSAATSQYWRLFVLNNWGYQSYIQFMEVGFYGCQ